MKCDICGADLPAGATACAECGAAVGTDPSPVAAGAGRSKPTRRTWLAVLIAIVALTVIGVGGWMVYARVSAQATPEAAALRMMNAFASYDAQGILDNATHSSLTETDVATFIKQAADSKTANKGLPAVKDIKVTKTTLASDDATSATVQLSANWLTDAATKKYAARDEILTVVKQNGKWLVRLFQ